MSSIFNTFYLLYKSNAADAIKGNKDLEKSTKDTQRALNNTSDTTKEVGLNFVKMAESAAAAIGAISGFEILKAGVQQAIDLNTNLKVLADNYQTTASKFRAAGLATQLAGGDFGTGVQNAIKLSRANKQAGLPAGDPEENIRNLRNNLKGKSLTQQQGLLDQFGITDEFTRRELTTMSEKEFNANLKKADFLSKDTNKASLAAYEANKNEVGLEGQKDDFFNRLLIAISTPLDTFLKKFGDIISHVGPATGSAAVVGGTTLGGWLAARQISKFFKPAAKTVEKAAGKVATGDVGIVDLGYGGPIAAEAGAGLGTMALVGTAALAAGTAAGYGIVSLFQKQIEAAMVNYMTSDLKPSGTLAKSLNAVSLKKSAAADPMTDWQNAVNDPAHKSAVAESGKEWDKINESKKYGEIAGLASARSTLTAVSQLTPPASNNINLKIDKIEISTQATDSAGIAAGIGGALEEKLYTALGFIAGNIDNGQSR